jgi:multiple sugar transport system permease protein
VFLKNFVDLFHNKAFLIASRNTLKFSFTAVPLAVILALGLALMLEARIPLKSQFRTFFLSPMMVPVASVVLIWQVIFSYGGTMNQFLAIFGADKIDWLKSDYCLTVITILFPVEEPGLQYDPVYGGPCQHPEGAAGGGVRGGRLAVLLPFRHQAALSFADDTVRHDPLHDKLLQGLQGGISAHGQLSVRGLYMLQHFMNNTFKSLDYQKLSAAAVVMALFMVG